MQKVFENIIEKLEQLKNHYHKCCLVEYNEGAEVGLTEALHIVKQEAADYNKGITDYLEKLNELEKQYTEQYGCEIIEMYADVVRDFKEWLAELID